MGNGAKEDALVSAAGEGGGGVQSAAADAVAQVVNVNLRTDGKFGENRLPGDFHTGEVVAINQDNILEDAAERDDTSHLD